MYWLSIYLSLWRGIYVIFLIERQGVIFGAFPGCVVRGMSKNVEIDSLLYFFFVFFKKEYFFRTVRKITPVEKCQIRPPFGDKRDDLFFFKIDDVGLTWTTLWRSWTRWSPCPDLRSDPWNITGTFLNWWWLLWKPRAFSWRTLRPEALPLGLCWCRFRPALFCALSQRGDTDGFDVCGKS